MNDSPMPPDPFSGVDADWSGMAAGLHGFFSALLAAGFAENVALHLTTQCLNTMLAVLLSNTQQQPGT